MAWRPIAKKTINVSGFLGIADKNRRVLNMTGNWSSDAAYFYYRLSFIVP